MDTTFIKQCEKAEEIQKLWEPKDGDFCWHDDAGDDIWGHWEFPAETSVVILTKEKPKEWWFSWLWLPTQSQLQAMVAFGNDLDHQLERFTEFVWRAFDYINGVTPIGYFASMEQLWLAFVQKELHQKVWNGSEWITT